MIEVRQTERFRDWLAGLRDVQARRRINQRIIRLSSGNVGDAKYFDGIGEMRIDHGPGYRVYFMRRGEVLVVLLCGGDKSSQARDIETAKAMAKEE